MRDKQKRRDWMRNKARERRKAYIDENGPCQICGSSIDLEIDHKDRNQKTFNISWLWLRPTALALELKKCWVLCSSCHLSKTKLESSKPIVHGTLTAYKTKGCRCRLCKDVTAKRERDRRAGLLGGKI
jgi:5-methylcytosine-specific restriction endonuclease McrA